VEGLHRFVSDHDSNLLQYSATVREKNGVSKTQPPMVKKVN
jgi:hypothetical protein